MSSDTNRFLAWVVLLCLVGFLFHHLSTLSGFYRGWPPKTDSVPAQIQARELAVEPGATFKGRGVLLLGMEKKGPVSWFHDFFPTLYYKFRVGLGNDLMNDAEVADIPILNEYGHWISPPMLALLAAAFYRPEDLIDRAAQAPRAFRPNLARLLGVSLVVSDQALPGEIELYRGVAVDYPVYIHRVAGANLGQYSPVRSVVAADAAQILDHLQAPDFDGRKLAVLEQPLELDLVEAGRVTLGLHKGPRIRVEADSSGTSLLVLPIDYSHCLRVEGTGLVRMVPVNLAQTGVVVRGKAALDITYGYGLFSGTACRKRDLERAKRLKLEEAATGRLFHDSRAARKP